MTDILFQRAMIFDGWNGDLKGPCDVRVADGVVKEISERPLDGGSGTETVRCEGRTLMPGLIDAHVHVYAASVNVTRVVNLPASYLSQYAGMFLRAALDRGFTTVRDVGGADVGLARAAREGLMTGARLYYGGRIVSQTGGHGDMRLGDEMPEHVCGCACYTDRFATIADGVDQVRKAVREELRRGASHVKIMGSGGVASPTDPLDRCQYSDEEIVAAVDEAVRAGKYIAAHCHPTEAVRRCARLGVRSIEHATMIDDDTAKAVVAAGAYTVPTMAVIFGLLDEGEALGFPAVSMAKLRLIADFAISGLDVMKKAGVKMGLGTDLLGAQHTRQSDEFTLRARVLQPLDILRSACAINAELLCEEGRLGCVREGAFADLLLVDGNPLKDISLLASAGRDLSVIVQAGKFHKRTL